MPTEATAKIRPHLAPPHHPAECRHYEGYWLGNGIEPLKAKGALRVEMLRDDRETETEFVTISYWASIDAMTGGAGTDPHRTPPGPRPRASDRVAGARSDSSYPRGGLTGWGGARASEARTGFGWTPMVAPPIKR